MMLRLLPFLAAAFALRAEQPPNESLQYTINWPSGLSLGEGRISSTRAADRWNHELQFEAAVPGFAILDRFLSVTMGQQCSVSFEKQLQHGPRKGSEKLTFDKGKLTRQTVNGGKSELDVAPCTRDALAFLFHLRQELAQGRIPPAQDVFYGGPYRIRSDYKGAKRIKLGEAYEDADLIVAHVKGPVSSLDLECYFGKDAARTPLLIKIPLALATFSVELVR